MNNSPKSYFLAGICGVGMSSLALLLKSRGNFVRGSDIILEGSEVERLKAEEIFVVSEQEGANTLTNKGILVVSSAIHSDNLVLLAAQKANLIIQHRADVLAEVAAEYYLIAVSGTHGKTTTSGMIGYTLHQLGYNPITYVGGKIMGFSDYFPKEENEKHLINGKAIMVIETDESDASFLKFHPDIAIITNIDKDHLGAYGENFDTLIDAFKQFAKQCEERGGLVIGYGDDKNVRDIVSSIKKHILYGSEKDNDVLVNYHSESNDAIVKVEEESTSLHMEKGDEKTYLNATATALACHSLGIPLTQIFNVLTKFPGMERRMQMLGEYSGIAILSDHADHPTEIKATLQAVSVRYPNRRLFLILQPHRYTRVTNCFSGYAPAVESVKNLVLLDIFPAGESCNDPIALNKSLRDSIQNKLGDALMPITTTEELFAKLPPLLESNDIVLFMGPGDIGKLAQKFSDTTTATNFKF
jgi:UDP-N-acetylmuramate--alanine ligase